jgi:16S rRNA (cytidine1402-2'-O)-methyltransferase
MLYIVPTPIGNLEDITLRAIHVLKEVDFIYAEDTRTTGILLKHYQINTALRSFHAFNEHKVVDNIVQELKTGKSIALVSDAGTPGISDPGFLLVRAARESDVKVSCLPGATAFVPALVSSGISSDKFYFEGFLPHKKGRQTRLKFLQSLMTTIILYESTHRLEKFLLELKEYFGGDTRICVSKEISKKFENHYANTVDECILYFGNQGSTKGEFVITVDGSSLVKVKSKTEKKHMKG